MSRRHRPRAGTRYRPSREERSTLKGRRSRSGSAGGRTLPPIPPLLLQLLGGILGLAIVIVALGQLLGGRSPESGPGDEPGEDLAAWYPEVELAARDTAAALGLRENWIVPIAPGSEGGDSVLTVIEFRFPGDLHKEVLNLTLTRAIEALGGSVVRGVERNDARVELEIARRGTLTHRFILQRYSRYERHAGRLALVIDDFGRASQATLEAFAALGIPWSATVIPGSPEAARQARWFSARGVTVLVHMPMEPEAGEEWELGEGALYLDTPRENVADLVDAALAEVPGAVGLNNHMGSAATADTDLMRALMRALGERELFFLDSRTTGASVAGAEAERAGLAWAGRDIFLDPEDELDVIEEQFALALDQARRVGRSIIIGHPRANTLAVLERDVPRARDEGFEFVTVDRLLSRPGRRP